VLSKGTSSDANPGFAWSAKAVTTIVTFLVLLGYLCGIHSACSRVPSRAASTMNISVSSKYYQNVHRLYTITHAQIADLKQSIIVWIRTMNSISFYTLFEAYLTAEIDFTTDKYAKNYRHTHYILPPLETG
jgi:F0F1-type ATP synthase membrane subunit a